MCKTIFLLLTALCLYAHVQAQAPGYLYALNTAGTTGTSSGTTYTYSVGEAVVFSNSCSYTPGVVQPTCICIVSSVVETFDKTYNVNFFPNPSNGQILVETDFTEFTNYTVSSMDGRIIESHKFDYSPIHLGKIEPGAYLLRLFSADNQIFKTVKIIKQ